MYKVEVLNEGSSGFRVKTNGYEFAVDTKGPFCEPPAALLASLGSCLGVYIRKYAEGAKMEIPGFTINVEGELAGPAPFSFKTINVKIAFKGAGIDERRKKSLLAFIENCPVGNTLRFPPKVNIEI